MKQRKTLKHLTTIESSRVRVEIYYDTLISNVEAGETAIEMINTYIYGKRIN